jgi:hypothetical protein
MRRIMILAAVLAAAGCGSSTPAVATSKSISWKEYERMPPEDQADPYVLNNLDDEARAKLAARAKSMKR